MEIANTNNTYRGRYKWTKWEDDFFVAAFRKDLNVIQEIAYTLKRNLAPVAHHAQRLNLALEGEYSLGFVAPQVAKWFSESNEVSAFDINCYSGEHVYWICSKCKKEYSSTCRYVVRHGNICPRCKHNVSAGEREIMTVLDALGLKFHRNLSVIYSQQTRQ